MEQPFSDENSPKFSKLQTDTPGAKSGQSRTPFKPVNDDRCSAKTSKIQDGETTTKTPTSSPYTYIRQLDSAERWIERTSVVTKQDHIDNLGYSKGILMDLINMLPVENHVNTWIHEAASHDAESGTLSTELSLSAPSAREDVDELSDLLGGLNIAKGTPLVKQTVRSSKLTQRVPEDGKLKSNVVQLGSEEIGDKLDQKGDADDSWHSATEDAPEGDISDGGDNQHLSSSQQSQSLEKPGDCITTTTKDKTQGHSESHTPEMQTVTSTDTQSVTERVSDDLNANQLNSPKGQESKPEDLALNSAHHTDDTDKVFDNEINPFKPKTQLMNSPDCMKQTNLDNSQKMDTTEYDPFKPRAQLANSPDYSNQVCKTSTSPLKSPIKTSAHSHLDNATEPQVHENQSNNQNDDMKDGSSLPVICDTQPVTTHDDSKVTASKSGENNEDLVTSCEGERIVEDTLDKIDPFKSKKQLVNSPSEAKQTGILTENLADLEENPFIPKQQLANSPDLGSSQKDDNKTISCDKEKSESGTETDSVVKSEDDRSCFSSADNQPEDKKQLNNEKLNIITSEDAPTSQTSDKLEQGIDETKPESLVANVSSESVCNMPVSSDFEDPFKPKSQLVNSPDKMLDQKECDKPLRSPGQSDIDPFKPTQQLASSFEDQGHNFDELQIASGEPKSQSADPYVEGSTQKVEDVPTTQCPDDESPFQPKAQLANSPTSQLKNIAETDTGFGEEVDPFKPKAQLVNSPEHKTLPTAGETPTDPPVVDEIDPFKPKSQLTNSPAHEITQHVADSQSTSDSKDEDNPFKSKSKVMNSPSKDMKDSQTKSVATVDMVHNENPNPFEPKSQIMNSPAKTLDKETDLKQVPNECVEKIGGDGSAVSTLVNEDAVKITDGKLSNDDRSPNTVLSNTTTVSTVATCEEDGAQLCQSEPDLTSHKELAELAEGEEFVPATQAFNDPAFFDMLENSKGTWSSDPKRGSVLLKFDPLQERRDSGFAKPASPGPSHKQGRMSDMWKDNSRIMGQSDDSVCLFGTPPRVARRRTLTRRVHNNRVQSIEEENVANEVDMIFGLDGDENGMDTMLENNLVPPSSGTKLVDVGELPAYTESEMKQISAELSMHYQELMLRKDKEFQERMKEQEEKAKQEQVQSQAECDGLKNKIKMLQGKLKSLNEVMKEYTDLITQASAEKEVVLAEKDKVTVELTQLHKSNSQLQEDNKTLEKSFDDLFHRYEKLKNALEKAAETEKVLKKAVEDAQEKCKSFKETNKKIKDMAEAKLAEQDEKFAKLNTSTQDEIRILEATIKRKELQITGLETTLEQKKKENKELTDLCDSLLNKVAPS